MNVNCPSCGAELENPEDRLVGQGVTCPVCGRDFVMPGAVPDTSGLPERIQQTLLLRELREIKQFLRYYRRSTKHGTARRLVWVFVTIAASACLAAPCTAVLLGSYRGEQDPPAAAALSLFLVVFMSSASFLSWIIVRTLNADDRKTKRRLDTKVDALSQRHSLLVESWGGAHLLHDLDVVNAIIDELERMPVTQLDAPKSAGRSVDAPSAGFQPHRGQLILTLGIVAWFIPIIGVVAWALGHSDLEAMERRRMDPEGYSMTNSGKMLGMIAVSFYALVFVVAVIIANQ